MCDAAVHKQFRSRDVALSDDDWQDTINANLFAAVRLDRAFLPGMLRQGSGVIIRTSSIQRRLPLFEATFGDSGLGPAVANNTYWVYFVATRT